MLMFCGFALCCTSEKWIYLSADKRQLMRKVSAECSRRKVDHSANTVLFLHNILNFYA